MSDSIADPKQRQIVRMIMSGQWTTVFSGDDTREIIESMRFRLIGKLVNGGLSADEAILQADEVMNSPTAFELPRFDDL